MSDTFAGRKQNLFYVNDDSAKIPKRWNGKTINVINKSPVASIDSKDGKENPTPRDVLNDFFESTSVHGLQYFGKTDVKVGVFGKILWTCTMLVGFICLSLMVIQFLRRYSDNPTNTYIESFYMPIFQAPFPAVTICSFAPIPLHRRVAIMENVMMPVNLSSEFVMEILKYGHHITLPYAVKKYKHLEGLKVLMKTNQWTLSEFLKILRPCEDVVESCWWSNESIDCVNSFKVSYTSNGLCCSFNYLLEDYVGRDKKQPTPQPLRSVTFGRKSGLRVIIRKEILKANDDKSPELSRQITNSDGLLVLIHHSMDFPGLNCMSRILQKNHELEVSIKPELYRKPVGLYHRNDEQGIVPICIPDNENRLDYFPTYRYSNCYANCRIRAMIEICGCVPFIYDYLVDYYKVNRCEIDGLMCIQDNVKEVSIVKDIQRQNFTCFCRTPCEDVTYDGFPNTIALTLKSTSPMYANMTNDNAVLRIFMNSQVFQVLETIPAADEIYLLASIGGIFSLFLGCSFISVVEIVYFCGLMCRAILSRRKSSSRRRKKKRTRHGDFART